MIEKGELLGGAGSYKAYKASATNDSIIVEFDQPNRATYLCADNKGFETIKNMTRMQVIRSQPEGFEGRVFHKENRLS